MKAWHFTGTNEPLIEAEIEEPKAPAGYVVIDVKAAGLCHSDVGVLRDPGWMGIIAKTPIVMGHEIAGVITELGEGVTEFAVGDKVAVCPTGPSGEGAPGYSRDGGFAEKTTAPAADLVKIPDGLSFKMAAAGTDAGMTSYHAIFTIGGAEAGQKVGMIGIGGLGQFGLQAAVAKGLEVYAVDTSDHALKLAQELGAKKVAQSITEFKEEELDLIIDYAGFDTTTREALATVKAQGKVVLVGMGKLETTLNVNDFILGERAVLGSNGGTKEDMADVYELMQSGKLNPTLTEITFAEIPAGIEQLERGEVVGRLVAIRE
ncbi:zinc-binding dehydrogenase [Facklamia sp. DSM 111018]|uniref:Zinc-binding dehydrogenase n=1 Tax=Facklamia lactis TaxID=2749967 RepID=A0ABS0LSI4_9LACT|nr:zinc-binding dehydrogenase [Facklamia lactis]MBG9981236.1 zinc-binding dehydrogenase [Facklamia lactis]MBG9987038.1 zinc-binding dehydrogenase [Facklamia lactis]